MIMFLEVLNKVNIKYQRLYKPILFFIIDLLPFAEFLELLAIDHSLTERRIIFDPCLLKFSHVLVAL